MRSISAAFVFVLVSASAQPQQYVISTVAGGFLLPPTPGPAVNATIGQPHAIARDPAGSVYFASLYSIFKIDPNGLLTHVAGTGRSGDSGDGGPATRAQLTSPTALALDKDGNLYIADGFSGRIRRVSPQGIITTVAGNGKGCCWNNGAGDGGPATSAQLYFPYQLAVDAAGNLYIGEWNTSRVRRVSADGIITTVVGKGRYGYSGDGGPAIDAEIGAPWGLTFDSAGSLYISDAIPGDDIEPSATLIRKVTPDGIITTVAGTGDVGYAGDGGPATDAQFSEPGPLAVDGSGNLYIADGARIRKISPDGIITTIAGDGRSAYSGDGGPAVGGEVSLSVYGQGLALAADSAGNLYIADLGNNRVRKISPAGMITTVAGNGNADCCYSGDSGPATSAQLYVPVGVAIDRAGNLYVADTFNDRLRKVSTAGIITTVAGTGNRGNPGDGGPASSADLAWPAGLAPDDAGNLYIADSADHRVRKISADGVITTVAGNGICCGFSGDGGLATRAQLDWPRDVAMDGAGNLYIADTVNNRVRMVSPAGIITTVAGNGDAGYSGDGGPAINASLNLPSGVALDGAGNLYIGDTNNFRVRKVSTGGIISTVAGNGDRGYSGDGGSAGSAQLATPLGLKLDSAGNLYIADGASVRVVSPAGIITTVTGNGTVGYSGDGGPANGAQTGAWGLTFDSAGNVYVADPWNNAVRLLKPVESPVR
jgi:trimeric autotransporter adhesin